MLNQKVLIITDTGAVVQIGEKKEKKDTLDFKISRVMHYQDKKF